jgi:hypothetical protein
MSTKYVLLITGILFFVCILLLSKDCSDNRSGAGDSAKPVSSTTTVTKKYDSIIYKPAPIINIDSIIKQAIKNHLPAPKKDTIYYPQVVLQHVDTAAILRDYYAIHTRTREWRDTNIFASLTDTISQNKIIGSSGLFTKLLRPTTINTTMDKFVTYNHSLYIGAGATAGYEPFAVQDVSASLLYTDAKGRAYGIDKSIFGNRIQVHIYAKLFSH